MRHNFFAKGDIYMNSIKKVFTLVITLAMIMTTASAAGAKITMIGNADPNSLALTLLVTDKDADTSTLKNEQILYINQYPVSNDGSFAITLPVFEKEYTIHTNALTHIEDSVTEVTLYIDPAKGSDYNDGKSEATAFKSFSKAYSFKGVNKKIILMGDATFADAGTAYTEDITIEGKTGAEKLTLPTGISLKGNLTISKVTLNVTAATSIFANGNNFKIDSDVTSARPADNAIRMTVWGGTNNTAYTGNTNVTLLAGHYTNVFGGSKGAILTGNTNVVLGGNANTGDGNNDDDASTLSPCYIYGGGESSAVTGETNVTLADNAVTKYVVGTGSGSVGTAPKANIFINGGKVMNVYGSRKAPSANCEFNITMTGGLAEAIFGGCESAAMTGNTYVNLLGGDVSRRVYTGCYNNTNIISWDSDNYVKGSTYLTIAPGMKLATKTGLSSGNQTNMGVFSGSRTKSKHSDEINTIIFLNGCYNDYIGKIGGSLFNTYQAYTLDASEGGEVKGTANGVEHEVPSGDKYAVYNGNIYKETDLTLNSGHNTVEFKDDFKIHNAIASFTDSKVSAIVNLSANNLFGEKEPTAYVAVYDDKGDLMSCRLAKTDAAKNEYTFDMGDVFTKGETYTLNVMIWDKDQKPLINVYEIIVK